MDINKYAQLARVTDLNIDQYYGITGRATDVRILRLLHALMGLQTEVGELMDVLKKYMIYGKSIDWINVAEELGDIQWYWTLAAEVQEAETKLSISNILSINIAKLEARYGEKFDAHRALNRDLETERKILEQ